jgi:hypothetical protein
MLAVVDHQASTAPYGAPLINGCTWATWVSQCSNLTVYGNGNSFSNSGCGPPNGCTFGPEFQCTELAQRYAYYAWGEPAVWDGYAGANGSAAQMWNAGPALPVPLQQLPQGGGVAPQQGDLLVFGPGWLGNYYDANGHVAVVSSVSSGSIGIVQENGTPSGSDLLGLNGSTVSASGYTPVIGWLRVGTPPSFTASSPPGVVPAGTSSSYSFAASGNPSPGFSVRSGSLPLGLRLSASGVLSGVPTTPGASTFSVAASNTAGATVTPSLTMVTPAPQLRADVNGDGKSDLVAVSDTSTWVMLSNG